MNCENTAKAILLACHQPYFLPPLSFFSKWAAADHLVLLDELQFVTSSSKFHYANRCKLGDDKWYTIPVQRAAFESICDVKVTEEGWSPSMLLARIRNDYRKTPYVVKVLESIEEIAASWVPPNIVTLNIALLRWAAKSLGIDVPIRLQSELGEEETDDRDVRLAQLAKKMGCDTYLAGPSGRKYMHQEVYKDMGIGLRAFHYEIKPYQRGARLWVPYQSVIDVLCYHGPEASAYLGGTVQNWE